VRVQTTCNRFTHQYLQTPLGKPRGPSYSLLASGRLLPGGYQQSFKEIAITCLSTLPS